MYSNYNPNPQRKRVGDCVIRAISKALNMPWEDVYINLCIEGYMSSDLPSGNYIWGRYLIKNGFKRAAIPDECSDCYTIENFCIEHPQGTFVIGTGTHAVAVVDGVYYDAWDSGTEQPIYFYYKGE